MCYSDMRSPSLGYVQVLFEVRAVFIFSLEALIWKKPRSLKGKQFREMISWETHMSYSEMRSCFSGYVTVFLEVSAVYIFSAEALHWKVITFIWEGKNFMKCFFEKCTCVTLKWEDIFWNMSKYCSKLEHCSFSL